MIGSRPLLTFLSSVFIGESPALVDAMRTALRVASTKASVLIRGEEGTGRGLLARLLHDRSGRSNGPFLQASSASIGDHFGDLFEEASGGTLFLEEVANLSGNAQVELLRVLEHSIVERHDRDTATLVDVRFVAGTGRDIEQDVVGGRFRRDLFHRLAVIELTLPPLRERGDDVRMLAEHFVGHFASANDQQCMAIARETLALLRAHPWPGNVRQLRDTLERATAGAAGPLLVPADLPIDMRDARLDIGQDGGDADMLMPLEQLERLHVKNVVAMTGGDVRHAAALLGIGSATLQLKLSRYRAH
jgi:DNA-binding NtrC family response regulator